MSKKIRISEYKGFELWDTPMPEGWSVHSYPVQVTCNGEHVNNFADANEAMSVIDGMDAYTIAYHMRTTAPAQPTSAGDEMPADWIPSDDMDSLDYAVAMLSSEFMKNDRYLVVSHHFKAIDEWKSDTEAELADLRSQLAAVTAERDAAITALLTSFNALLRGQPQIKGVLVAQDFQYALTEANKVLTAHEQKQSSE